MARRLTRDAITRMARRLAIAVVLLLVACNNMPRPNFPNLP